MSGLRYGRRRTPAEAFVQAMIMLNLGMAAAVFGAWSGYSEVLADPLSVIAGSGPPIRPSVLEYPYLLLWVIPLLCGCLAFVTAAIQSARLARFFAVFPVLLAATCGVWLYFYVGFWN